MGATIFCTKKPGLTQISIMGPLWGAIRVNGIMGSDESSGEMLQIDQIMKRSLLYIWLLPILGLMRLFEASVGSKAGPRCRLNFVIYGILTSGFEQCAQFYIQILN